MIEREERGESIASPVAEGEWRGATTATAEVPAPSSPRFVVDLPAEGATVADYQSEGRRFGEFLGAHFMGIMARLHARGGFDHDRLGGAVFECSMNDVDRCAAGLQQRASAPDEQIAAFRLAAVKAAADGFAQWRRASKSDLLKSCAVVPLFP